VIDLRQVQDDMVVLIAGNPGLTPRMVVEAVPGDPSLKSIAFRDLRTAGLVEVDDLSCVRMAS
jgi:hypothetical protein